MENNEEEQTPESVRSASWAGIGTRVRTKSVDEAIRLSGLDWDVERAPLSTTVAGGQITVDGWYANVTSAGDVVGVVSESYQICQNRDAFRFANYISDELEFVKGGMTSRGLVYVIGELPGQTILGDRFTPHVIFQNSFNGFCGVKAAIIPLRIVCQNQFNMAWRQASNTVSYRHSSGLAANMAKGQETLKKIVQYMDLFRRAAEAFAVRKISDEDQGRFLDDWFEVGDGVSVRSKGMIERNREHFMEALNHDDNANFRGSVWGLINAFADYLTHPRFVRSGKRPRDEVRFTNGLQADGQFKLFTDALARYVH